MMNLLNESGLQKLVDFLTDELAFLLVEAAQPLLHRFMSQNLLIMMAHKYPSLP
jgi:hypothetical protein